MNWISRILAMMFLAVLLFGCSQDATEAWKPVCRHDAVYAALTVGEEHPTRIITGVTTSKGIRHAQAQAFIRGKWRWLAVTNGYIVIEESIRKDFVQDHEYSVLTYAMMIKRVTLP